MHVQTREGIFNGGGYGGGVFDGSEMGFGGIGGYEQAPAGIGGLTAPNQWTIKTNEWPSTVSQAVVKSTTRWKELPAANPGMTLVTINGQPNLSPWKVGQVVSLPASWVPAGAPPATPAAALIPVDDVAFLTDVVNSMLYDLGYTPISGAITQINATLCGATDLVAKQVQAGNRLLNAQDVADFMGLAKQYAALMGSLCQPLAPWTIPMKSAATSPPADTAPPAGQVCSISFGTKAPVVAVLQATMNDILVPEGYEPIPISSVWDATTCGAMFALRGAWDPSGDPRLAAVCPGGWQVPPACPKDVTPVVPKKKDETTKTGTSMAWMVGGLVGAAALAGLYLSKKRK